MPLSPSRIATRHMAADVWLPDYLGASAPVAELAMKFIKENVADSKRQSPSYAHDPASVAGGVFYLTLKGAGLEDDAKRMWSILDNNAGLHVGSDMGYVGDKVWGAMSRGRGTLSREEKGLLVGALGVELLQRTRQLSKAKIVNRIFVEKYGDVIASMTPGRNKAKPPNLLLEEWMTPEIVAKAGQVAQKLGNDPAKALTALDWLAEDINFDELGRAALGAGSSAELTEKEMVVVRPLGEFLDWGAETLIAFGIALLQAMGAMRQVASFTRGALAIAKERGLLSNRLGSVTDTGHDLASRIVMLAQQDSFNGAITLLRKHQSLLVRKYGGKTVTLVEDLLDNMDAGKITAREAGDRIREMFDASAKGRNAGDAYLGNPNGESIYPNSVDHGYDEPLAGGTDVMRKLQNRFLHEQGREPRPESERLASAPLLSTDKLAIELAHMQSDLNALTSMIRDSKRQ